MLVSLKVSFFVIENLNSHHQETEISSEIDFDDTEHDENSELDEESKDIRQLSSFYTVSNTTTKTINHFIFLDLYRIQYSEFTTPPPKVA